MKSLLLPALLAGSLGFGQLSAQSGLVASFKASRPLNGATLGLRSGSLMAYGGLDLFHLAFEENSNEKTFRRSSQTGELYISSTRSSSVILSGTVMIPHAGLRLYLPTKRTASYLMVEGFFLIPSAEFEYSYRQVNFSFDGSVTNFNTDKFSLD